MNARPSLENAAHAMIREIYEQPAAIRETLKQYVTEDDFRVEQCAALRSWIKEAPEILIAASGSSRHAGLAAEVLIESMSGVAVDVEYASEYAYRSNPHDENVAVMVISQSGETADTLAALRKANTSQRPTLAITNVPSSKMAREATVSFPTSAGKELAVPATKSFITQLLNVYLLALLAAESRGMENFELQKRLRGLHCLSDLIERQLDGWRRSTQGIANAFQHTKSMLFLGRGPHYPIAREGALKLKESAYIHAEGYPSGELKHGPNALVSEDTPLLMLATVDRENADSLQRYERVVQLMEEMKKQGADIIAVANTGDRVVGDLTPHTIYVDETDEPQLLLCEVIPLQLLSYAMSVRRGIDVDRPRNLSKAVLVD